MNKNIDDLKNILNNEIENLRKTKENIENENKKNLMEKKTFEEKVIFNSNSNIFESLDEIKFIINQLETHQKVKNRKIFFNLLYRATRDGKRAYDFHIKCDGNVQQLVFIKTVKGEVFGGYTSIGYKSRGTDYKDEKAFLFSLTNKKIYNSKKGKTIVLDYYSYGPSFYDAIVIGDVKMFEEGGYTKENSSCGKRFDGFSKDYEINNGDGKFYIQEIEVYQILYK